MGPYEDLFRERPEYRPLADDFETKVFGKIRHRKRQRRQLTVMSCGLAVLLGLGVWFWAPWTDRSGQPSGPATEMLAVNATVEEVPLLEEITLQPANQQTEYALELVNLSSGQGGM